MKDLCSLALEKIGFFKIMNIKPNFSKLKKCTTIIKIQMHIEAINDFI